MKTLNLIFAILLLTSCASSPVLLSNATPAPSERLLAFQEVIQGPSGTLVVTRDKGFQGSACYFGFFINDVLAARLGPSETGIFYLPSGELVLRSGYDPVGRPFCNMRNDEWTQRETILREGEIKYFRMSIDASNKFDIQRSDPPRK